MKVQELNTYTIFINKGKILVLKRKNGIWEFPGGGVEWGENPEESAIREAKEETSLNINELKLIGITSAKYNIGENEKHSVYIVYSGETSEDKINLSEEHDEYRWLKLNELKYMKLGFNAEPIIDFLQPILRE